MIQQAKQFPAFSCPFNQSAGIVIDRLNIRLAHVSLQTRGAIGQMHEGGFAHYARRRGDAPGDSHRNPIQLLVGRLDFFGGGTGAFGNFWCGRLKAAKLFNDVRNSIFTSRGDDLTAHELVWIDVTDQLAQSLEMLLARASLIVVGDDVLYRLIYQLLLPKGKARIIESVASLSKF